MHRHPRGYPRGCFYIEIDREMVYDTISSGYGDHSSVVERLFVAQEVEGSIPSGHPRDN